MAAVEKKSRPTLLRRPTLTKAIGKRICDDIALGIPKTLACPAHGIAYATAQEWVRRGNGQDERPPTETTRWFAAEWAKAEGRDVKRRSQRLEKIAERDDAQAVKIDLFWLAARHPEEFAPPNQRVELTGPGGGEIVIRMAFDTTPISAKSRRELGGPITDVEGEELP